jgi:acyl-CoA thioesterase I
MTLTRILLSNMTNVIRAAALLSFISLAIFLSACGASSAKIENQKPTENVPMPVIETGKPKIVAFGDSLTAGFGLTERESYPYLLQEKLKADGYDYEVINAGVSGDTSAGGLERVEWTLDQQNVQILILELGANDMLRGLSVSQMKKNLDAIIKKAKAKNVEVLLCGLFPPEAPVTKDQSAFAAAFRDLARENNVAFMPFFLENVGGVRTMNQADGIHPNAEGTRIVTENVYKSLKPLLKN